MKSLFKTVFVIMMFSIITRVVGFLFRIYISRTIGSQSLGEYQVSFSIFMVLLTIISSGLPFIISRLTAKYEVNKNKQQEHKMVTAGLIIGVVLSLILCALVVIFIPAFKHIFADERCITILLILLPALVFSSVYSTLRGNIWGKRQYFALCITELFEQIARVIIFIILIQGAMATKDGAYVSAISLSVACSLSAIMVIIIYFALGGKLKRNKDKTFYRYLIKKSTPITGVRLAGSLVQPIIALVIPLRLVASGYSSAQALSLYGIAMGMTLPFLFIPSTIIGSLSTALVPDLSAAFSINDMEHIRSRVVSSIKFTVFISVIFIPIFLGAGTLIGNFFYNNSQSGIMLEQSAWVILPLGLTNISSSLLNSLGYEIKSMRNYILGAIIMLLSIWFLPLIIGINALVWGFGICFVITSILNLKMIGKIVGGKINILKTMFVQLLFVIPSASICAFVSGILANFLPLFFNLMISCGVCALFYFSLCIVFNQIEINSIVIKIKKKFYIKRKNKHKKLNI